MAWDCRSIMQLLFCAVIAATSSFAQEVIESASFGHRHGYVPSGTSESPRKTHIVNSLSPDSVSLPGWDLSGSVIPQIVSDKLMLSSTDQLKLR